MVVWMVGGVRCVCRGGVCGEIGPVSGGWGCVLGTEERVYRSIEACIGVCMIIYGVDGGCVCLLFVVCIQK